MHGSFVIRGKHIHWGLKGGRRASKFERLIVVGTSSHVHVLSNVRRHLNADVIGVE